MATISLTGQVRCTINHLPTITATNVTITFTIPTQIRKGAYGVIGPVQGIGNPSGTMTFVVQADKQAFNLLALSQSGPQGFELTFEEGLDRYLITGAVVSEFGLSNDPGQGNNDKTLRFEGSEIVPL